MITGKRTNFDVLSSVKHSLGFEREEPRLYEDPGPIFRFLFT